MRFYWNRVSTGLDGRAEMSSAERREWTVSGMDCAACTVKVTKAVERQGC